MSRRSVATRWGVSTATIKRYERRGLLCPIKFNSRMVRYRSIDVERCEREAMGLIPALRTGDN